MALSGGDSLPRFGLRRFLRGRLCYGARFPVRCPAFAGSLFQHGLHAVFRPPCSAGGGIFDPVAAVVVGLTALGNIPELAPQALRSIVQPTVDKFPGRGFDLFL